MLAFVESKDQFFRSILLLFPLEDEEVGLLSCTTPSERNPRQFLTFVGRFPKTSVASLAGRMIDCFVEELPALLHSNSLKTSANCWVWRP